MIDLLGMPDFSGNNIDSGRLKLLEVLGSGGFGVVYKAIDNSTPTPRYCAVKCLRASAFDREQLKRYDLEIYLHKKVSDHENILTFYRVCRSGSFLFLVLELCDSGDLFSAITRHNLYVGHEERTKAAILQIIDAVQHCHDNSIFHRDIKPENILVGPDGLDIRLADFGLATDKPTSMVFGIGSLGHMPPGEVVLISSSFHFLTSNVETMIDRKDDVYYSTLHSDIWAIGVIMVNIVASLTPWDIAAADDDERYAKYCADGTLNTDDIASSAFGDLLRKIFKLNPLDRITLPQIREAILSIDTFYVPNSLCDNPGVPHPFAYYPSGIYNVRNKSGSSDTTYGIQSEGYQFLDHGRYISPSPSSEASARFIEIVDTSPGANAITVDLQPVRSVRPRDSSPAPSSESDTSLGLHSEDYEFLARYLASGSNTATSAFTSAPGATSAASSGSISDSRTLVTPETHACDPDIDVPTLNSGDGIDQSGGSKLGGVPKYPPGLDRVALRPTRALWRIKAAVRRLRAFASSKKLSGGLER